MLPPKEKPLGALHVQNAEPPQKLDYVQVLVIRVRSRIFCCPLLVTSWGKPDEDYCELQAPCEVEDIAAYFHFRVLCTNQLSAPKSRTLVFKV